MNELTHIHTYKDKSNPRSLINICPNSLEKALEFLPEEYLAMNEHELKKDSSITHIDDLLRISFWREYDAAMVGKRRVVLHNIYTGVCSQTHVLKNIFTNPIRLAYMLTPPKDYEVGMTDILHASMKKTREMLDLPLTDKNGKFDGMLGNVIQKILETSLDRVRGAVVSRSESKVLQANLEIQHNSIADIDSLNDMAEIQRRLDELEKNKETALEIEAPSQEIIDVIEQSRADESEGPSYSRRDPELAINRKKES